tara:strand:+ start:204 stop:428 length:225 start_codon:yes stop_codon:yes gene_type:complete
MTFKLVSKGSKETIDKIDNLNKESAKFYFMGRKQLTEDSFDELFDVVKTVSEKRYVKPYKWWKEENTKPDTEGL